MTPKRNGTKTSSTSAPSSPGTSNHCRSSISQHFKQSASVVGLNSKPCFKRQSCSKNKRGASAEPDLSPTTNKADANRSFGDVKLCSHGGGKKDLKGMKIDRNEEVFESFYKYAYVRVNSELSESDLAELQKLAKKVKLLMRETELMRSFGNSASLGGVKKEEEQQLARLFQNMNMEWNDE